MTQQEIAELIKHGKMGEILFRLIHQIPRIEIDAYVQPITRSCLRLEITIKCEFNWDEKVHGKAEGFHMFVEDVDGEIILYHEFFSVLEKNALVKIGEEEEKGEPIVLSFTVDLYDPLPP